MIDTTTINIIKTTVPIVKTKANDITKTFYSLLFKQYPETTPYFNQTHQALGNQPKALANAVVAYAEHIDKLEKLNDSIEKIVQKHCALGIQPEHYPMVGDCLLQAIKVVLGNAATEEIMDAWGKAYSQLAQNLINAEEALYKINENKNGGWRGERDFTLTKRIKESETITSFYFEPTDGKLVSKFKPGQYLTVIVNINDENIRRNYSLSDAPGKDYLRISVKRESNGKVSNFLHDTLKQGDTVKFLPPCGNFILRENKKPLVLITGGVGITPAISMINAITTSNRQVHFIHAALNSKVHAFKEHIDHLSKNNDNISSFYIYNQPTEDCKPDAVGLITKDLLSKQLPKHCDIELYFLGPKPFMNTVYKIAHQLGVPNTQIHYEFFGPEEQLTL